MWEASSEYEKSTITTDDDKSLSHKSTTDDSQKSTTDGSQKSTTDDSQKSTIDEDPNSLLLAGMKRKLEEDSDSESEEYMYGDSDESDDSEEEEEEQGEDEALNEDILINGAPYSHQDLLELVLRDYDKSEITNSFLNKARRYLKSVTESNGFDVADAYWPGHITGLTTVKPRSKIVIGKRDRYPEGYKYMLILADKAIQEYNQDYNTNYKVESVDQVNSKLGKGYVYYITFTASLANSNDKVAFQTLIWDNMIDHVISVNSCRKKA